MAKRDIFFKIGDIIEVKVISEIIAVRPDGQVLVRNFGNPIPINQLKKVTHENKSAEMDDGS
ncbi:MAG: hypothetical protein IPJ81_06365 [Chitinophagaceae bacterium]|jgi:hypothetical protein|nr:hypothetical protein [Chitinophagaceae bacterium]